RSWLPRTHGGSRRRTGGYAANQDGPQERRTCARTLTLPTGACDVLGRARRWTRVSGPPGGGRPLVCKTAAPRSPRRERPSRNGWTSRLTPSTWRPASSGSGVVRTVRNVGSRLDPDRRAVGRDGP